LNHGYTYRKCRRWDGGCRTPSLDGRPARAGHSFALPDLTRTASNEQRRKQEEKDDGIKRKTPETRPNKKESLPNFAQVISMELVSYPESVMAQFELKL